MRPSAICIQWRCTRIRKFREPDGRDGSGKQTGRENISEFRSYRDYLGISENFENSRGCRESILEISGILEEYKIMKNGIMIIFTCDKCVILFSIFAQRSQFFYVLWQQSGNSQESWNSRDSRETRYSRDSWDSWQL